MRHSEDDKRRGRDHTRCGFKTADRQQEVLTGRKLGAMKNTDTFYKDDRQTKLLYLAIQTNCLSLFCYEAQTHAPLLYQIK